MHEQGMTLQQRQNTSIEKATNKAVEPSHLQMIF